MGQKGMSGKAVAPADPSSSGIDMTILFNRACRDLIYLIYHGCK
jgi:hypothetical protein